MHVLDQPRSYPDEHFNMHAVYFFFKFSGGYEDEDVYF